LAYLVGGIPAAAKSSARAKARAPSSDKAAVPTAAAAAAATREKERARRRRRTKADMLGRGYEYMDLDDDLNQGPEAAPENRLAASAVASHRGAGTLGFAGSARKAEAEAAGLTTQPGDLFGDGPTEPMMPSTWQPGRPAESGEAGEDT
jgi:PPE-repeat protein